MLVNVSQVEDRKILATDGPIGSIETFLFDDERWVVRYVAVSYGILLWKSTVLISPILVDGTLADGETLQTVLSKKQVKDAPSADIAKPVSRRKEEEFHRYHEIPIYWSGAGLWGTAMTPAAVRTAMRETTAQTEPAADEEEYHLRSTAELEGYRVAASDGEVGRVSDFIVEDDTWAIRYLRIKPTAEIRAESLVISPHWVYEINWFESTIQLSMTGQQLAGAPAVRVDPTMTREDEEKLHEHFGQPRYWL